MGKLYENKELWKKVSTALLKKLRTDGKINWTDEEIDKKVEEMINDTKRIENHKLAVQIKEKIAKQQAAFAQAKEEYKQEHGVEAPTHGFNAYIYGQMDVSGTPEAHDKNKAIMNQICDEKESRKLLGEFVKGCYQADMSKYYVKDLKELFQLYLEHTDEVIGMFAIDRLFNTLGNYKMNPEFKKFYKLDKQLFEGCSIAKCAVDYYSCPAILLFPEELDPLMLMSEAPKLTDELSGMLKDQNLDGFAFDPSTGERCLSIGTAIGGFFPYKQSADEAAPVCDAIENGTIPKTIGYEYKLVKDGKDVDDVMEGVIKMANGEKYEVVKRTPEELKEIDNAINHCVEDKEYAKNFFDEKKAALAILRDELKNAKNWYQPKFLNHKEYNDLMNKLNDTLSSNAVWNAHDESFKAFEDIKKLSEAYVTKNAGSTNSMRQKRMDICSRITDLCNLEGKTEESFYTPLDGQDPSRLAEESQALQEELADELDIDLENENNKSFSMNKEQFDLKYGENAPSEDEIQNGK